MSDSIPDKKKRIITTVPPAVVEQLDALAQEQGCSRDALVAKLIAAALSSGGDGATRSASAPHLSGTPCSVQDLHAPLQELAELLEDGLRDLRSRVNFTVHAQEQIARASLGSLLEQDSAKASAREFLTDLFAPFTPGDS